MQEDALLITEDKDFGELVLRLNLPHKGILLIRLSGISPQEKQKLVIDAFQQSTSEFPDKFSVLEPNKLRIRKLK